MISFSTSIPPYCPLNPSFRPKNPRTPYALSRDQRGGSSSPPLDPLSIIPFPPPPRPSTPGEGGHVLDPDVRNTGHLTTTQIQILAENQRKRIALLRAKSQLHEVSQKYDHLATTHQKDLDEQYEALEFLHWDAADKADTIAKLKKDLEEHEKAVEGRLRAAEIASQQREENTRAKSARREAELNAELRVANAALR